MYFITLRLDSSKIYRVGLQWAKYYRMNARYKAIQ
jgi:hypothetical protein